MSKAPARRPVGPLGRGDDHPRIHIWQESDHVLWSFGPCGSIDQAATAGDAVDDALRAIQHRPAAIFYQGREHGRAPDQEPF